MASNAKGKGKGKAKATSKKAQTAATAAVEAAAFTPVDDPKRKDSDRDRNRIHAIVNNPRRVRLAEPGIEQNWRLLSGYIHMAPSALGKLALDSSMNGIWRSLYVARAAKFGLSTTSDDDLINTDLKVGSFWRYLYSTDVGDTGTIKNAVAPGGTLSLDDACFPEASKRTAAFRDLFMIAVCARVLGVFKADATWVANKRVLAEGDDASVYGHNVEDWNRALQFTRGVWRKYFKGVKDLEHLAAMMLVGNNGARPGKPFNCDYLTVAEEQARSLKSQDLSQSVGESIHALLYAQDDNDGEDDDLDDPDAELAAFLGEVQSSDPDNALAGSGSRGEFDTQAQVLANRPPDDVRPAMAAKHVVDFLKRQGQLVKVEYDVFSDDKTFEAAESTFEARGQEESEARAAKTPQARDDFFRKLHSSLTSVSAQYPEYDAACRLLGFDDQQVLTREDVLPGPLANADDTATMNFVPTPIQVMSVAWWEAQERHRAGILGLGCGLGKTMTTLWGISRCAAIAEDLFQKEPAKVDCRPTLVVAPPAVLAEWYKDWDRRFRGELRLFIMYGTPNDDLSPSRKSVTMPSAILDSIRFIESKCPPGDIANVRTVFLTSYATLRDRTLRETTVSDARNTLTAATIGSTAPVSSVTPEGVAAAAALPTFTDLQSYLTGAYPQHLVDYANSLERAYTVLDDDTNDEIHRLTKTWSSYLKHRFARLVMDEGQTIKGTKTRAHKACHALYAPTKWIVSATPASNRVDDYIGILNMLWHPSWEEGVPDDTSPAERYSPEWGNQFLQKHPDYQARWGGARLWILNPEPFAALVNKDKLTATLGRAVLTAIAESLILRIPSTKVFQVNGESWSMAQDIKSYRITTVELSPNKSHEIHYRTAFDAVIPLLCKPGGKSEPKPPVAQTKGLRHAGIHRHLHLMTTDLRLARLNVKLSRANSTPAKIKLWSEAARDGGASRYFKQTRMDPTATPYASREQMAEYMTARSPKLRYICRLLSLHVLEEESKMIIWYNYPIEGWYLSTFFQLLSLPFFFIGSAVSSVDRAGYIERMNDPRDETKILLASAETVGFGVNLHGACHIEVMLSMAPNINTHIQMIGRVHRIGQQHTQLIYVLFLRQSYDQIVTAKTCRKGVVQLLGEADLAGITLTPDELTELKEKALASDELEDDDAVQQLIDDVKGTALTIQADDKLQQLLGLRSTRLDWDTAALEKPWADEKAALKAAQAQQNTATPTTPSAKTRAQASVLHASALKRQREAKLADPFSGALIPNEGMPPSSAQPTSSLPSSPPAATTSEGDHGLAMTTPASPAASDGDDRAANTLPARAASSSPTPVGPAPQVTHNRKRKLPVVPEGDDEQGALPPPAAKKVALHNTRKSNRKR